jgi:hypothetical protein
MAAERNPLALSPEFIWIGQHSPVNGRERLWIDEWPLFVMGLAGSLAAAVAIRVLVAWFW